MAIISSASNTTAALTAPIGTQAVLVLTAPTPNLSLRAIAESLLLLLPGKGMILEATSALLPAPLEEYLTIGYANLLCLIPAHSEVQLVKSLQACQVPAHFRSFHWDSSTVYDRQKNTSINISGQTNEEIAATICQQLFRPNVACFVLNSAGQLLCCHRSDVENHQIGFQIPQGGLEAGEDYYTALARELREETCLWDYQIISELHPLLRYIWPTQLSTLPYLGQAQKYFLVRISDAASKQLGPSEEFDFFRWADIDFLLAKVVPFKRNIYQRAWELLNPPIIPEVV